MAHLDTEYIHNIKTKVEIVLTTLIDEYGLDELISNKLRYRIDFNRVSTDNKFYILFHNKQKANGEYYRYGTDFVPDGFQQWLNMNFPEFMHTEEIYDNICSTGFITQKDLRDLNEIYHRHPPKSI